MISKRLFNSSISLVSDRDYRFRFLASRGLFHSWSDEKYLRRMYAASLGGELNLDDPKTFNEKLQWLKLNDRNPLYTVLVDKYLVREHVASVVGSKYLIPLLGVWDRARDIDFGVLPSSFVLMCICKDKTALNVPAVIRKLEAGLRENYYFYGREWPYRDVPKKIICEEYLTDAEDQLTDYKVHNFNGVPRLILVCRDRFKSSGMTEDFFSTSWEHLPVCRPGVPNSVCPIPKPGVLDEILELSRVLSRGIPFLRTDFYVVNGRVFFGELTFFPASGFGRFYPPEWDINLGDLLDLPAH